MKALIQNTLIITSATLMLTALSGCSDSSSPEPTGPTLPTIEPGTASISYESVERSATLSELRAVIYEDHQGVSELRLFFSDKPMQDVVVIDFFGEDNIRDWVYPLGAKPTDEFPVVLDLRVDPNAPDDAYNGYLYPNTSLSTSGKSAFDALSITENKVSGTLAMQDIFEGRIEHSAWNLNGSFEAPLTRVKQPTPVTGASIADSDQARQLNRVVDAMGKADMDSLKSLVTAESFNELNSMIDRMASKEVALEWIMEMAPKPDELKAHYENGNAQLFVAGKTALLLITEKTESVTSTEKYNFQWQEGQWLMN